MSDRVVHILCDLGVRSTSEVREEDQLARLQRHVISSLYVGL